VSPCNEVQLQNTLLAGVLVQDLCNKSVKTINEIKLKVKVKITMKQATKFEKGSRVIALLFLIILLLFLTH